MSDWPALGFRDCDTISHRRERCVCVQGTQSFAPPAPLMCVLAGRAPHPGCPRPDFHSLWTLSRPRQACTVLSLRSLRLQEGRPLSLAHSKGNRRLHEYAPNQTPARRSNLGKNPDGAQNTYGRSPQRGEESHVTGQHMKTNTSISGLQCSRK